MSVIKSREFSRISLIAMLLITTLFAQQQAIADDDATGLELASEMSGQDLLDDEDDEDEDNFFVEDGDLAVSGDASSGCLVNLKASRC